MTSAARQALDLAMSEAQWQATVTDLARTLGWGFYHTRDARRSNPGFPDLVLLRDRVIFAELKTEKGRVSNDQRWWLDSLAHAGAEVHVWRPSDWEDVRCVLGGKVAGHD